MSIIIIIFMVFAGCTPDEMTKLCSEDPDGWIMSSHIAWTLEEANRAQQTSIYLCMNVWGPDKLHRMIQRRSLINVQHPVLIANVGQNADNSVYLAAPQRSDCHWVLITVELTDQPVLWQLGVGLASKLSAGACGVHHPFGDPCPEHCNSPHDA